MYKCLICGPPKELIVLLCRSKLNGRIYFAGRFYRVFDRGQNNCYFNSAVKNTNMPQNLFLQHRLVLTGTIQARILDNTAPPCIRYSMLLFCMFKNQKSAYVFISFIPPDTFMHEVQTFAVAPARPLRLQLLTSVTFRRGIQFVAGGAKKTFYQPSL